MRRRFRFGLVIEKTDVRRILYVSLRPPECDHMDGKYRKREDAGYG